jgi:hypothetical protein
MLVFRSSSNTSGKSAPRASGRASVPSAVFKQQEQAGHKIGLKFRRSPEVNSLGPLNPSSDR